MNVLIVEDEIAISELIRMNLTRANYQCDCAYDGEQAITYLDHHSYDIALLDIMLPKINGYELLDYCKELAIPVIFISAKTTLQDKINGLHLGADDYLVKPFAIDELLARVESVLRRYRKSMDHITVLDIVIDTKARKVKQHEQVIDLTNKEYDLLLYLIQNKNIALYRDVIYQRLWDHEDSLESRTLDLHIQRLRKKLHWHAYIKTVFRIGYMLEVNDASI